jgi:hypothetical protein
LGSQLIYKKDFMTDRHTVCVIAVADDSKTILQSLGSLLKSADYAVRLFASATAMLEHGCVASDAAAPVFGVNQFVGAPRSLRIIVALRSTCLLPAMLQFHTIKVTR